MTNARNRSRHAHAAFALTLTAMLVAWALAAGPNRAGPCATETEPNESPAQASPMPAFGCVVGALAEGAPDHVTLTVGREEAGTPFTLEVEASAASLLTLSLQDAAGLLILSRSFERRLAIPDMVLDEGGYGLALTSADGTAVDYELRMAAQGPIPPGHEREPNDRVDDANPLDESASAVGRLVGHDTDVFELEVTGEPQLWRFEALGEGLGVLVYLDRTGRPLLVRAGGPQGVALRNVLLLPGRHFLQLSGADASYTLRAMPQGPPDVAVDRPAGTIEREPNDDETRAERLRFDELRVGLLAEVDDLDVYRFTLDAPERVRLGVVPGAGGGVGARLGEVGERYYTAAPDEVTVVEADLRPGDHVVYLRATQPSENHYRLRLERAAPTVASELEVDLHLDTPEIAAFWERGQRVTGSATVTNRGAAAEEVALTVRSSHSGWRPWLEASVLRLPAGAGETIPLTLDVLPDARDDGPVRLVVEALDAVGRGAAGAVEVAAVCGAEPVAPRHVWPLPEPLLGGLNVAWAGLGGAVVGAPAGAPASGSETVVDGLVSPATGWWAAPGDTVTIALAGDRPTEVAGFVLDPFGLGAAEARLRGFEVALSTDGEAFTTVLTGELSALPVEQAFVLDPPVPARFARLSAVTSQGEGAGGIGLGEFKVIAAAGSPALGDGELDLASPRSGGHVVWSSPPLGRPELLFGGDGGGESLYAEEEGELTWTIGFHNDRAAQVVALERSATAPAEAHRPLGDVAVAVALESPTGPWRALATWPAGEPRLELPAPTWARYLRFTAPGMQAHTFYALPTGLRILERAATEGYRSIVGEWGQGARAATYEAHHADAAAAALAEADDNDGPETARELSVVPIEGTVVVGEDVDWYRITVPEGDDVLEVFLAGTAFPVVAYELLDASGRNVPLERSEEPEGVRLSASVVAGAYLLRLEEPPRSIVFAWDNSGSMGPYLDVIQGSIASFVREVDPGREVAQLLPFSDGGGRFLLPDWSGEPLALMTALNDYDRSDNSSNAELNLLTASEALRERSGARAVILITDAESEGYAWTDALWASLEEVRPRVFAVEASSAGSAHAQDLMQAWAGAAGGHYDSARSTGDFEIAFARASCHLRRPAHYRVSAETTRREPPGPGAIAVRSHEDGVTRAEALPPVGVILDASGSMYERLGGETRIDLAKRGLLEITSRVLPEGTPFALRVFGHREPNACRTDLELPLGPLDPDAVAALLPGIRPQTLSGTPLAESLLRAADDLQGRRRGALLVVLTDGEESCGGDVEAAIRRLAEEGIVARLSIVGFRGIEDDVEEQLRAWAELGGGGFFEAGDPEELAAALRGALTVPFDVLDAGGLVVATGRVGGEAVDVPAGTYTVRTGARTVGDVRVAAGEVVQVVLDGP